MSLGPENCTQRPVQLYGSSEASDWRAQLIDSNGVPLWAFLLTALAAVVGPFVTTWASNQNARKVLALEHANERALYLLDKKHAVYDDTLSSFAAVRFRVLVDPSDGRRAVTELNALVGRLRLHAPPKVVAQAAKARAAVGEWYGAHTETTNRSATAVEGASTELTRAFDALAAVIREDMDREQPQDAQTN